MPEKEQQHKAALPVFRWAGSKRKLLPRLLELVPQNYDRYIEPFVGSGCLFFALQPKKAILGDFNADLIAAYRMIARRSAALAALLEEMPSTRTHYYKLRSEAPNGLSALEKAARFLYLNRFCFNGVYRTNLAGLFNVPRGSKTGTLLKIRSELDKASKLLRNAQFFSGDFEDCIRGVGKGDFVYLDPPYTKVGGRYSGEYGYGAFSSDDLERLFKTLCQIDRKGATFVFSYRYSAQVHKYLGRWHVTTVQVQRHVAGFCEDRHRVRELLASNKKVQ